MNNLRKKALSGDNIALVHSNIDNNHTNHIEQSLAKGKADWKKRKHNRFIKRLVKARANGDIDTIIKVVGNSSPIYNDTLRNEHLILLMAAQSVMKFSTLARYSNGTIYILVKQKLLEEIPHIPGIRSRRIFLSYKGFQLLDHWNKKYKRFQPYYNAFVNEKIRGKAKEYSVVRAIGAVHKDIKEIAEINTEMNKKILKREKAFKMQRTIQDAIRGKKLPLYFTSGPMQNPLAGSGFSGFSTIGTPVSPIGQIASDNTTDLSYQSIKNGLFSGIFGGK